MSQTVGVPDMMPPQGLLAACTRRSRPSLRHRPLYSIQLANGRVGPLTGYNSLLRSITVTEGPGRWVYRGTLALTIRQPIAGMVCSGNEECDIPNVDGEVYAPMESWTVLRFAPLVYLGDAWGAIVGMASWISCMEKSDGEPNCTTCLWDRDE